MNDTHDADDTGFGGTDAPSPTPRTPRTHRTRWIAGGVAVGVLLGGGAVVGLGAFALYAFNPLGDEYVCSEGEVPGGRAPVGPGEGNACYTPGKLPKGVEADPFGNRPMSYNCDKDGYRVLVKTTGRGAGQVEECVADDIAVPTGWAPSDES